MSGRRFNEYSEEFKQSSIKLALEAGSSIRQTAQSLGVHEKTLYYWVRQYKQKNSESLGENLKIAEELKRLKKENARLIQERDILKKAAAYFASET